jgi:hypothetical protein
MAKVALEKVVEYTAEMLLRDVGSLLIAISPLLVVFGFIYFLGFSSEEEERVRRRKKGDYEMPSLSS